MSIANIINEENKTGTDSTGHNIEQNVNKISIDSKYRIMLKWIDDLC